MLRRRARLVLAVAVCLTAPATPAALAGDGAPPDVFNGRIAFSSFRADPPEGQPRTGDIWTMNPDGTGLRRLTTNPADDAQSDWSPDGADIAWRIRKPDSAINFEVARMTAGGGDQRRLTETPEGQASSQPAWFPDKSAILFRRSGGGVDSSIWRMGTLGESPVPFADPPGSEFYPSLSPDMTQLLFATVMSPTGDTDRGIFTMRTDGTELTARFDVPGAFDSAPAWSPDGTRIAFESNADVAGANPEHDQEIWVMDADGSDATQLTRNVLHDEGPAWSPDGTLLAYTSGPDNDHGDIKVMTLAGVDLRQLTFYEGRDESPDWQAIPAPHARRRCGDVVETGPGAHDVRARGRGLSCRTARRLAARWIAAGRPARLNRWRAEVTDFGGTLRVVLERGGRRPRLVAFLDQPEEPPPAR